MIQFCQKKGSTFHLLCMSRRLVSQEGDMRRVESFLETGHLQRGSKMTTEREIRFSPKSLQIVVSLSLDAN